MSIRDEIDASFGTGPTEGPVHAIVAEGHRALRRRRLASSCAAAVVAVVLGGSAVYAAGGGGDTAGGRDTDVVGSPSATATREAARPTRKQVSRVLRMQLADYGDTGRLEVDPRARVVDRLDNPYDLAAPGRSVAVALEFRGATYWYVMYRHPNGAGGGSSTWSGDTDLSFEDWVHGEKMLSDGTPDSGPGAWPGIPDLDLVRFVGGSEVLEPVAGVTILAQRASPAIGDAFATGADQSAVALVRDGAGERYYVLARSTDGTRPQYIAVKVADGGPTLDAFLDLARERYATDGGGLL
jgi:hypothetical protein